jgi:hypothetical protein
MSIRLNIQADDPEVEAILIFMQDKFGETLLDEGIFALERALRWIKASDGYYFRVDPNARNEISLACGRSSVDSCLPSETPVQSQE